MTIQEVDPLTLKQWMDDGSAVLIDVREPDEHASECIAHDHPMPLSSFNPQALPEHDGKVVVYYCASGTRTAHFGQQLADITAGAKAVYHLTGGIMAWKQAGNGVR